MYTSLLTFATTWTGGPGRGGVQQAIPDAREYGSNFFLLVLTAQRGHVHQGWPVLVHQGSVPASNLPTSYSKDLVRAEAERHAHGSAQSIKAKKEEANRPVVVVPHAGLGRSSSRIASSTQVGWGRQQQALGDRRNGQN
jgi:hypothetical protein